MRVKSFVSGNFRIGMVALHHVIIYDDRQRAAYDFVIYHGYYLTFGEDGYQLFDLFFRPKHIFIGIHARKRLGKLCIILHLKIAQLYLINLMYRFHNVLFVCNSDANV